MHIMWKHKNWLMRKVNTYNNFLHLFLVTYWWYYIQNLILLFANNVFLAQTIETGKEKKNSLDDICLCFFTDSKSFGLHYMVRGWTRTNGHCYSRCSAVREKKSENGQHQTAVRNNSLDKTAVVSLPRGIGTMDELFTR
jgi:hypothetical protein